jgi:hypothetical protein
MPVLSPDIRLLAIPTLAGLEESPDRQLTVFDAFTGAVLYRLREPQGIEWERSLSFTADGRSLLTGTELVNDFETPARIN